MKNLTADQAWMREALQLLTPEVASVATDLGVSPEALRTWRRGARRPPAAALDRLARRLRDQAAALQRHASRRPR
jgi:DNA-binding transcriptional regulator YiaG